MSSNKAVCVARGVIIALLAYLAAAAPASAQDLDAAARQRLFYQAKPAVVLVSYKITAEVSMGGKIIGEADASPGGGSGWLITPDGYVVTNGHVVEEYHQSNDNCLKYLFVNDVLTKQKIREPVVKYLPREVAAALGLKQPEDATPMEIDLNKQLFVELQNGRRYSAQVKEYSPPMQWYAGTRTDICGSRPTGKDVAILKIEGRDLPTVRIGDSERVEIGDNIYVAGYPGVVKRNELLDPGAEREASFTRGQISSLKQAVGGSAVLQMDASITWGNSGGPVFSERGEVIGMATLASISENLGAPQAIQGFNFAVPANIVREFLRSGGVNPETRSMFDRAWERALNQYYAGDYQAAVASFDEVGRIVPGLPDAERLRREAMARIDEEGSRFRPWILAATALALMLIVAGLFLLRRRSNKGGKAAGSSDGHSTGHVVVQSGPLRGNRFAVTPSGLKIGRDPSTCQVVLGDDTVSREHAMIVPSGEDSDVLAKNLSGTNPTLVNDRAVQETKLKSGDQIKVGNSVFLFEKP